MKLSVSLGLVVAAAGMAVVAAGWRSTPTAELLGTVGAPLLPGAPGPDEHGGPGSDPMAPVGPVSNEGAEGPGARGLPWLHNFSVSAESGDATPGVVDRMARWRAPDPSCSASAYGGFAITADVAEAHGTEEVLASYTQGVLVLDEGGRLIASATAPMCRGSADEIGAIAAGDAHIDRPVIAMAVTTGGHHESSTWLVLYRVTGGVVAPVFSALVEERVGDQSRTGDVTLLTGALLYHGLAGTQTLWTYSAEQARYVEVALVRPPGA